MKASTVLTLTAIAGTSLAQTNATAPRPKIVPKPGQNPLDALLDNLQIVAGPAPKGCAPYELIVARGTSEFGAFGFLVGDTLVKDVVAALPKARGYAVDYPANTAKGSLEEGAADVYRRFTTKAKECPDMKFAFSGYSQGASVLRSGLVNVTDPALLSRIVATVAFGDPGLNQNNFQDHTSKDPSLFPFPDAVYAHLREFCNKGDPVCSIGTSIAAHIGYNKTIIQTAADFIVAGFKGTPLPAKQSGAI